MNFDIDYQKLTLENPEFGAFVAATMQAIVRRSLDDWVEYMYMSYQQGLTPEDVAAEVKADI